jgi:hypothetical protein
MPASRTTDRPLLVGGVAVMVYVKGGLLNSHSTALPAASVAIGGIVCEYPEMVNESVSGIGVRPFSTD